MIISIVTHTHTHTQTQIHRTKHLPRDTDIHKVRICQNAFKCTFRHKWNWWALNAHTHSLFFLSLCLSLSHTHSHAALTVKKFPAIENIFCGECFPGKQFKLEKSKSSRNMAGSLEYLCQQLNFIGYVIKVSYIMRLFNLLDVTVTRFAWIMDFAKGQRLRDMVRLSLLGGQDSNPEICFV